MTALVRRLNMALKRLIHMAPAWSWLVALSRARAFQFLPIFLLLVPVVVKLLNALKLDLPLPASVELMYFSALSALIGTAVIWWRCPSFTRRYADFAAYGAAGNGTDRLLLDLTTLVRDFAPPPRSLALTLQYFAATHCDTPLKEQAIDAIMHNTSAAVPLIPSLRLRPAALSGAFETTRELYDRVRPFSRYSVLFLLGGALLLVAAILIRNAVIVLRYVLATQS